MLSNLVCITTPSLTLNGVAKVPQQANTKLQNFSIDWHSTKTALNTMLIEAKNGARLCG